MSTTRVLNGNSTFRRAEHVMVLAADGPELHAQDGGENGRGENGIDDDGGSHKCIVSRRRKIDVRTP